MKPSTPYLLIALTLALAGNAATEPGSIQVDMAAASEVKHAAAMVRNQAKIEKAEQATERAR